MSWPRVSRRDTLSRYYLLQLFGFGVFLHRIHHDEDRDVFHNHPWDGISLIFGSYLEERLNCPPRTRRWWNWITAGRHHRVELPNGPVWTLFVHGRRYNTWEVIRRNGVLVEREPWRGIGGRTAYAPSSLGLI